MILRILTKLLNYFEDKRKSLKEYMTDCNIREVFESFEEFSKNKLVFIYDIDEYVQGKKNNKREFWVFLAKLMAFLRIFEAFFMGFIDDIRIRLLIMDYTLFGSEGNRLLYRITLICFGQVVLVPLFLVQYLEISKKLPIFKICHLIKYRIIKYPLNSKNYRKFCLFLKIYSLIVFNSVKTYSIICTIFHSFIFGSYPRDGYEIYSIFGQIMGNITFFIACYYSTAFLGIASIICLSLTQYLKYKFEEINTKIELSLKQMNIRLLMNAIHEHNYVERLTRDINDLFSKIIFIVYYILTLTSQLFLFIAQRDDTLLIYRIVFPIFALINIFGLFYMHIVSNQICTRAHEAYPNLFTILVNENFRMNYKQRLKLMSFMEKLSGPQIGFYCYDLFAMNSNGFYEYITIYVSNYFLIMSLFP